ncbi:SUF system NifU family Fe-S cluster assembly protein [bacterium]|nr:SUF system NifU family Fe-S cluster assembly protein [bacterium]
MDDLYREVILDHHRNPRGAAALPAPDLAADGKNPSCGDEVTLQLDFAGDRISGVAVISRGCAIATASGSMLAELAVGRTLAEVTRLAESFRAHMRGDIDELPDEPDPGDLEVLSGVRKFPARVKCALLPWMTALEAAAAHAQGRTASVSSTEV